jgi:hypothetical protein
MSSCCVNLTSLSRHLVSPATYSFQFSKRISQSWVRIPTYWDVEVIRNSAATAIQRIWRGSQPRKRFYPILVMVVLRRRAAVALQRWWRFKSQLWRRLHVLSKVKRVICNITEEVLYLDLWVYYLLLRSPSDCPAFPVVCSMSQYPEYRGLVGCCTSKGTFTFLPITSGSYRRELCDDRASNRRKRIPPSIPRCSSGLNVKIVTTTADDDNTPTDHMPVQDSSEEDEEIRIGFPAWLNLDVAAVPLDEFKKPHRQTKYSTYGMLYELVSRDCEASVCRVSFAGFDSGVDVVSSQPPSPSSPRHAAKDTVRLPVMSPNCRDINKSTIDMRRFLTVTSASNMNISPGICASDSAGGDTGPTIGKDTDVPKTVGTPSKLRLRYLSTSSAMPSNRTKRLHCSDNNDTVETNFRVIRLQFHTVDEARRRAALIMLLTYDPSAWCSVVPMSRSELEKR